MKNKKIIGFLILLFASIIWGLAFVFQDKAGEKLDNFTINSLRCFIGAIFLTPVIFIKDKLTKKEKKKEYKTKDLLIAGISCGVFLCIAMNLQQFGISSYPIDAASSSRSGFITALYVVFVPILSIILKKKVGLNNIISVILATIGMYLLCFSNGINNLYLGDLIVLGSGIGYSFQILCIDKFSNSVDGVKLSTLQFLVCGILSTILMFIFETPNIETIKEVIFPIIYLGVVSSGIGYTMQIIGQQYSNNPTLDSIVMSLESVFAVIGGAIILKERLLVNEVIGCIIMFLAIIIAQINFTKLKLH